MFRAESLPWEGQGKYLLLPYKPAIHRDYFCPSVELRFGIFRPLVSLPLVIVYSYKNLLDSSHDLILQWFTSPLVGRMGGRWAEIHSNIILLSSWRYLMHLTEGFPSISCSKVWFYSREAPSSGFYKTGYAAAESIFPGCVATGGERPTAFVLGACTHRRSMQEEQALNPASEATCHCQAVWLSSGLPQLVSTVNSWTAWCCDAYQLVRSRHLALGLFLGLFGFFYFMEQVTVSCSLQSLCKQWISPTNPPTNKTEECSVLTGEMEKGSIYRHIWAQQAWPNKGRRVWAQRKCVVPHAGRDTNMLMMQVLSLLPWGSSRPGLAWTFAALHKTCHGSQPGTPACLGGGSGLHNTSRHLKVTSPVLCETHSLPTALV